MNWGDVPSWVFGAAGLFTALYYRRKLRLEELKSSSPRLVMTHTLLPLPTLKGFRERAGVRVELINEGGSSVFIKDLYWGCDGSALLDATNHLVQESVTEHRGLVQLRPDQHLTLQTSKLDGHSINELHVLDVKQQITVHAFDTLPAKGHIAPMPGETFPDLQVWMPSSVATLEKTSWA